MCCRRSATCNAPCRSNRDTAGPTPSSEPPTTSLAQLVDLDPPGDTTRRGSDGRSVWIEPTAPRFTSEPVLAQEEAIVTWAMAAQADPPAPSTTVNRDGLDPLQADAAAASPATTGSCSSSARPAPARPACSPPPPTTSTLTAVSCSRVAPTAKAARTVERDTGIPADTVAKLLHEWQRTDRPPLPEFHLPAGATLVVDEAGMLSTPALHQLVTLADRNGWRLALVGDPRQLQGVGRGGLLAELCANGRVEELERLHRFTHRWEAAASLQLRSGDPRAFDAYEAHDRIVPGTLDDHLAPHRRHVDRPSPTGPQHRRGGVDQRPRRHDQPSHPERPPQRRTSRPRGCDTARRR